MTDAVVYEQFDQTTQPAGGISDPTHPGPTHPGGDLNTDLRRLSDVPMELSVEIGRTRMTVGETLQLRAGSIVTLDRLAGESVNLLVNGTPIARGEVVVVDEQFGLRVTEIVEGDPVPLPDPTGGVATEGRVAEGSPAPDPPAPASGPPVPDPPAPDLSAAESPAQD